VSSVEGFPEGLSDSGVIGFVRELIMRRYGLRDDQWERIRDLLPDERVTSVERLRTIGSLWRR
jgi:hypothetical protein